MRYLLLARIFDLISLPQPVLWNDGRYPRTWRGGLRYFREQTASIEARYWRHRYDEHQAARRADHR